MIDWFGWESWQSLLLLDLTDVPYSHGAYAISTNRRINRAVGSDPEGILHIGETNDLKYRIKTFRDCVRSAKYKSHMAGWRFKFFQFEKKFPVKSLRVRWVRVTTKKAASKAEAQALTDYLKAHCELPPLNYKFNWALWKELERELGAASH